MPEPEFRSAARVMRSPTAQIEKKTLIWLAGRMPTWVNSDHLTLLGLLGMMGAGASYALAKYDRVALLVAIVFLALNWFGDSLDGTLARVRNHQRPRYGFYVDKVVDCFSALFLCAGLAYSEYMSPMPAAAVLIAYYLISIEVYLTTYTLGTFHMTFGGIGPTELRILLALGNIALWWHGNIPTAVILDLPMKAFDIGAWIAAAGMAMMLLLSVARHTRELYRAEPIPKN